MIFWLALVAAAAAADECAVDGRPTACAAAEFGLPAHGPVEAPAAPLEAAESCEAPGLQLAGRFALARRGGCALEAKAARLCAAGAAAVGVVNSDEETPVMGGGGGPGSVPCPVVMLPASAWGAARVSVGAREAARPHAGWSDAQLRADGRPEAEEVLGRVLALSHLPPPLVAVEAEDCPRFPPVYFVHLGPQLPAHYLPTLRAVRVRDPDARVVLVTDATAVEGLPSGVEVVGVPPPDALRAELRALWAADPVLQQQGALFAAAAERLFVLAQVAAPGCPLLHLEGDVVPFAPLSRLPYSYAPQVGLAYSAISPQLATAATLWARSPAHVERFCRFAVGALRDAGRAVIEARLGAMASEMALLRQYMALGGAAELSVPGWEFDGASVGQFVDGTPFAGPGFTSPDHYLGPALASGAATVSRMGMMPLLCQSSCVPMATLHVHSKRTERFSPPSSAVDGGSGSGEL